jgi:hypothetical protein
LNGQRCCRVSPPRQWLRLIRWFGGRWRQCGRHLETLGSVETQVSAILGIIPHLVTKADLADVRASIGAIEAVIPHLATKADLADVRTDVKELKVDVASIETAIIKWIIATTLASAGLAFTIAKFVH